MGGEGRGGTTAGWVMIYASTELQVYKAAAGGRPQVWCSQDCAFTRVYRRCNQTLIGIAGS